jgi:HAE1 family hydrophobic/amphiphilic exporter-1
MKSPNAHIKSLYSQPLRVYVVLAVVAFVGILAGLNLPISLFPNSTKPVVAISSDYGSLTAEEFLETYGTKLEADFQAISETAVKVEKVKANYNNGGVQYSVQFNWGNDPTAAKKAVDAVVSSWLPRLPEEIQDSIGTWINNENSGFYAASFYSDARSIDALYEQVEAALGTRINSVEDADSPQIWNPSGREVTIQLKPEAMAALGLFPKDIERTITGALQTSRAGSVFVGKSYMQVQLPRSILKPDDLAQIPVVTSSGRSIHLGDVADINFAPAVFGTRIMKTSGVPSVILFATPKPGGNIKKMSEDLGRIISEAMPTLPSDIKYKTLVDPSEFISAAIENVVHEVILGCLLAVSVLFLFIGSLKNVATAAIEIPLSIILAFILMRFSGVNINLISLGGLALSAGMNVDASVVVMENIFRKFDEFKGQVLNRMDRLRLIKEAVAEVRLPVIASTIASLVVFLPLAFTSDLSYAILGDLAKTVVFSHGCSAIVALILVPTVRYQLMKSETTQAPHRAPLEPALVWLENLYGKILTGFIRRRAAQAAAYGLVVVSLAALAFFVLPKLPREVVGTPDSDMIWLGINSQGNQLIRQMDSQAGEFERDLLKDFGADIDYTFTQVNRPNRASILAKLKDRSKMEKIWHAMEARFPNTPELKFNIEPWNPSELPIPDPPAFQFSISGRDRLARRDVATEIRDLLDSKKIADRVNTEPSLDREQGVNLNPNPEQWAAIAAKFGGGISQKLLTDFSRVATTGRSLGNIQVNGRSEPIVMSYPLNYIGSMEDLYGLPVGMGGRIIPFGAIFPLDIQEMPPLIYRENQREITVISGRLNAARKSEAETAKVVAEAAVSKWQQAAATIASVGAVPGLGSAVVQFEDPAHDITDAISQLGWAIGISIGLIFIVLLLQFNSIAEPLLILAALPLGIIGVIVSLFVFKSTLSLNSALGVILLNGIAVNNSIMLVDLTRRLYASGLEPLQAAVSAATQRLRPILITSLTTVLGMLPIALGFGDGGKILQPLGIAVSGGLWISMVLTIFIVPALHVALLSMKKRQTSLEVPA